MPKGSHWMDPGPLFLVLSLDHRHRDAMAIPAPASRHRDTSPVHLKMFLDSVEEKAGKAPWTVCCNNHPAVGQDQGRAPLCLGTHLSVQPYKSTLWDCRGPALMGGQLKSGSKTPGSEQSHSGPSLAICPFCCQLPTVTLGWTLSSVL